MTGKAVVPLHWDANLYRDKHGLVVEYGGGLLEYIPTDSKQAILDLGCKTGELTQALAQKSPRVVGVDIAPDRIKRAKKLYPHLDFYVMDGRDLQWSGAFDIVFSNGAFHWIREQNALLESVRVALKPGGLLVCEFGARGNAAAIETAFQGLLERRGESYTSPFYFPGEEEYAALLTDSGFRVEEIVEYDRPTPLVGGVVGLENWIRHYFARHLDRLDHESRETTLRQMEATLRHALWNGREWVADCRRIKVVAEKVGL